MSILKYIGVCFFFFTLVVNGQSQNFIKAYGNTGYDYGRDIKQDNDTGYVITGSSSSFGADNGEAYLLKIDKFGEFEWSYNYGGSDSEWGESLVVTNDSSYAITGYTNSYGAGGFDFYLVRIDKDGTPIWENYYGGSNWDRAYGLVQLPDSGFVMVGESYSFNEGLQHGYMIRTDKLGEVIWETSITEDIPSFFTDVDIDGDSLIVCGGIGDGGDETFDGFVYKCHIDGTFGWDKRIGQEYNDYFNAVYAIAGVYNFGGARGYKFPTEKENMWMYRMDDVGVEIMDTVYVNESLEKDIINDIAVRGFDQDYYFVAQSESYGYLLDGKPDAFMGKMTLSGIHLATRNYGEAGDDIGQAIDKTRDGGVVFLCDTKFFSTGGNNILVIKINNLWEYPDLFGDIGYDDITNALPDYLPSDAITVYPNPVDDYITIPEINEGLVSIYSIDGQLIMQSQIISNQIDLSSVASGSYILTVQTTAGIYKKRLIKN